MTDAQESIHQIEYRWHDRRDLSPAASTMSADSLRAYDSWIRPWVRHPHADRLWESVCYQVQPNGRAALAWRYEQRQAAERDDGTRGRPLVSRVLAGKASLLTPEVAIALTRTGLPAAAGPRPGQVTADTELPVISADELTGLVRGRAAGLDEEAAQQEGLQQVVAAALTNPQLPLAIQIRDPYILKAPQDGLQCRLLWGLRRIVWPLFRAVGRGWSFSTFEPPLGEVDPTTLPDILFRQAQDAPTAPARSRQEVKVRPLDPAALATGGDYPELAGLLVEEYKKLGGDELKQLIAKWCIGDQAADLYRVFDELRTRQPPIVMSRPSATYVAIAPGSVPGPEATPRPGHAESAEDAPFAAAGSATASVVHSAPGEGRPPGDHEAPGQEWSAAAEQGAVEQGGLRGQPAVAEQGAAEAEQGAIGVRGDLTAQESALAELGRLGTPGQVAGQRGPVQPGAATARGDQVLQESAFTGGQAAAPQPAPGPADPAGEPATPADQQIHGQWTETPPHTGHDPAQRGEQGWFGPRPAETGQYPGGGQYGETGQYPGGAQYGETGQYPSGGQYAETGQYPGGGQYAETGQYPGGGQYAETGYRGNDPRGTQAEEYVVPEYPPPPEDLAGPRDAPGREYRGGFLPPGTPAPPQPGMSSQPVTQNPAPSVSPPAGWAAPVGQAPREGEVPPLYRGSQDQSAGRPPRLLDPQLQAGTMADLLKKLLDAQDDQEFSFILEGVLARDIRSQKERVDARRVLSRPDWYRQMGPRLRILIVHNSLVIILRRIVIPELNNPHVVELISKWAVEEEPGVIGSVLVAAHQTSEEAWQLAMEILQPRLAYRWMADNDMKNMWDVGLAPQYSGDSGRGLFKRKK